MDKKSVQKIYNYIIGDIHGCYEELQELEAKINYHAANHNARALIISCGDLIDRGPYSREVLQHFINCEKNGTHIAIMGNHELMFLQALEHSFPETIIFPENLMTYRDIFQLEAAFYPERVFEQFVERMNLIWLESGGRECLYSFGIRNLYLDYDKIDKEIISYLLKLPLFYQGDSFIITHAIPNQEDLKILLDNNTLDFIEFKNSVNSVLWNRNLPRQMIHNKLHISGHSPFVNPHIHKNLNAIQIDTGAVYGNKLTAYNVETDSYLYVNSYKSYREKELAE